MLDSQLEPDDYIPDAMIDYLNWKMEHCKCTETEQECLCPGFDEWLDNLSWQICDIDLNECDY